MDINTFKLGSLGTLSKISLSRSEAVAICSKGSENAPARNQLIKSLIQSILDIPDISNIVKDENIFPRKNNIAKNQLLEEKNEK
jgi:hypothetical protein